MISIVLLLENSDKIAKVDKIYLEKILKAIINDISHSFMNQQDFQRQIK